LRERLLGSRGDRPEPDDDERARRTATLFAIALVVVALAGLVFVIVQSGDDSDDETGGAGTTVDIGPPAGTEVSTYMAARERALADASGNRLAVVSFDQYVSEADAKAAVGSVSVSKLLAAPPGGTPSVVSGSMTNWAEQQVAGSREERDELQKMLPTVDDPAFRDFYQAEVNNLTMVIDGVKPDGPLVFGALVRGDADDLQQLARRPDVRLVDVGRSNKISPDAAYRGLRPEETARAGEPPTRPV
jgi:hypothetical protein